MIEYLGVKEFAERIGIGSGTVRSYLHKGLLPEPDALVGIGRRAVRGWLPETIDAWQANRPGRGARTDLHR
ncbi:MAG: transcriptional regulator [Actinomycetaceae bacterium]|nr:transcriptional regulator [Actinomycetaceae bacterium]MDY6082553.1 transcriptional regulator [Actinomycetaceae bacterium]